MRILPLVFAFTVLSPSVYSCFNDRNFTYYFAGKHRNCQNIRIKESRRKEMCSSFPDVYDHCPQSCGRCCMDDRNYRFKTRKRTPMDKTCDWLSDQGNDMKKKFCKKWSNGRMVRDACPVTCGFCQGAVLQRRPTF